MANISQLDKEIKLYERDYEKKYGVKPCFDNFLCTKEEYFAGLKQSLNNNVKLESFLASNDHNVKNSRLVASLNKKASTDINKRTDRKVVRHDDRAVKNINRIKNSVKTSVGVGDKNVVGGVSELRTVQDSKRISKTRHVVIVRESKENPKTPVAKFFNFMSFVAVALVGIFLGIFAGNMYIANKSVIDYSSISEAAYLPNYEQIYEQNKNKEKNKVSAANVYSMAEWQLLKQSGVASNYTISGVGTVNAKVGGINQSQKVIKTVQYDGSELLIDNITLGLITTAEKTILNFADKKIDSYKTTDANESGANYKDKPTTSYDLSNGEELCRKEYGISAYSVLPYLVSEKSVDSSVPMKTVDGGYTYQVTLNNIYGVINYVYYMMHMSGLNRPPVFYKLNLEFTVDDNFRFKELIVSEEYQIYYMGLPANCTASTTYTFTYGG